MQAADVDAMLAAHSKYLEDLRARVLLGKRAQGFRDTLDAIFDAAKQLLHPLMDCEAHVAACAATDKQARSHHVGASIQHVCMPAMCGCIRAAAGPHLTSGLCCHGQ